MEAPGRRNRVVFVLLAAVAGLVLFVVPSAWLHARGVPAIACAVLGLLVFPLGPLGWHLLGERRRRAAGATSSLTGGDRFVLRLGVVALAVLGPLLFFRPGQTWRAVRDHGTWFVPRTPPAPKAFRGDARLLAQVPAEAELVVWARDLGRIAGDAGAPAPAGRDDTRPEEILFALREGDLLLVVRGSDKALAGVDLAEANRELAAPRRARSPA